MCCESDDEDGCIFCGSCEISEHWADGSPICAECQESVEDTLWEAHLNGR